MLVLSAQAPVSPAGWLRHAGGGFGTILDGDNATGEKGEAIFREMMATASDKSTKSELLVVATMSSRPVTSMRGYGSEEKSCR